MNEETEQVDHFSHVYDSNQDFGINGNNILMIARFLTEVIEKETDYFASFTYPIKTREITNEAGDLIKVEFERKEHNSNSFLLTSADDEGAQLGLTGVGVKASQILSALLYQHEQNIKSGLAKKQEDIDARDVFRA